MTRTVAVEIAWAATYNLKTLAPALHVRTTYTNVSGQEGMVNHHIPIADLRTFNPPLSVWQLIEVACEPALKAQRAIAAADDKRARKRGVITARLDDHGRLVH